MFKATHRLVIPAAGIDVVVMLSNGALLTEQDVRRHDSASFGYLAGRVVRNGVVSRMAVAGAALVEV